MMWVRSTVVPMSDIKESLLCAEDPAGIEQILPWSYDLS
jgi:hypothetical protein